MDKDGGIQPTFHQPVQAWGWAIRPLQCLTSVPSHSLPQSFCLWDGRRNQVAPGSPSPGCGVSTPAWPGCGPGLLQQHGGHVPSWAAQPARCQALRHWLSQGQGCISALSAQAGHRSVWPLWPGNAVPPLPWAPNPRGGAPKTQSHLLLDLLGTARGSTSSLGWGWGVRIQWT